MERRIAGIDAASLDRQARFINAQIRERAFSWSAMMGSLEKLLPGDVRLVSLNPTVDEFGTVALNLDCVSRRKDGLTVLLDRLYADPSFKDTFPAHDSAQPDGTHRLSLRTRYIPALPEARK
jgi:Tfp pilus assembly protein PilN